MPSMDADQSLSALLSQALVAFTIEFDNKAEHQLAHRTTNHGSTPGSSHGPWPVSLVMSANCMQFVTAQGTTVREVERLARTKTNWDGMRRWGYITIEQEHAGTGSKRIKLDVLVRPTPAGRRAQETWRPLFGVIEKRWQERFGVSEVDHLRQALCTIVGQLDPNLPGRLPILHYGLFSRDSNNNQMADAPSQTVVSELPLSALLSRVLLSFAIEFERESEVSLAISANVLRLIGEEGTRLRDLPQSSGVSKEAIAMSISFLEKRGYAIQKPESPDSRFKTVRLTSRGQNARETYIRLNEQIENGWSKRFGQQAIESLRDSLEPLVCASSGQQSPLFRGLEPYPDNWRASVRQPEVLPHYPMVLHRGGYPDGS